LASRDFQAELLDREGRPTDAENADIFTFDYVSGAGKNYGTMVIILDTENEMQVFYGDNLGRSMEGNDKTEFFDFVQHLHKFANMRRWTYSPKNINQVKYTMQGLAAIKEGLFEGYYGTRKVSYSGEPTEARLVIQHNRALGETDARFRYVESLFIETADSERFKLQFKNLAGARAMLEHVRQGGKPYDVRGSHITEMVSEISTLARFNRASAGRVLEGVTAELVTEAQQYYKSLRENLKRLGSSRGYQAYFESWHPAETTLQEELVDSIKTMFVEQTLDSRIEAALPVLARLQQENRMKEADIFESWVDHLSEGTWALPETPEQQQRLQDLMSRELIVGPDATNATEQLYDLVGDDQLFDQLEQLASRDARANIWADTDVQARLAELGIQMPADAPADPGTNAEPDPEQTEPEPVQESRTKELAMDLEDPLMSDEEFETKYGDSRDNMQSRAGRVQDRRSGEWYDPAEKFDQLKNSPEFQSQMQRMARREGMAEGDAPIDFDWYRKQQQRQTRAKQKPGVSEGRATYGPITDQHKAASKKAFDAGVRDGKAGAEKNKEYMSSELMKTTYLNGYKQGKQGVAEASKEKTPGVALSKAYQKDFDGIKPVNRRPETALTGTYSKTGKPGGELKKRSVAEGSKIPTDWMGVPTRLAKNDKKPIKRPSGYDEYIKQGAKQGFQDDPTNPLRKKVKEQGVAEGGYPEVDHMPGPTIKRTQTGCKRCHGKGYVYKTPDGETHAMNRPDAKKYKCGKCDGIGFVKLAEQGVSESYDLDAFPGIKFVDPTTGKIGSFYYWSSMEGKNAALSMITNKQLVAAHDDGTPMTWDEYKQALDAGQQGVAETNVEKYKDLGATNQTTHFIKNVTTGKIVSPHRSLADAENALVGNERGSNDQFKIVRARKQGMAEDATKKLSGATPAPAPNPYLKDILIRHIDEVRHFVQTGYFDPTKPLFEELYEYFANEIPESVRRNPARLERRIGDLVAPYAKFYAGTQNMNEQGMAEASGCNHTMEGEMCPEHGLTECGMHESQVQESQEGDALLARIKSLALLR